MVIKERGIRIDLDVRSWKSKEQFIKNNLIRAKKLPEKDREKVLSDIWDKASPPEKEAKPEKAKKGDK